MTTPRKPVAFMEPMDPWQQMDSSDRWMRHRGRVELEKQPVANWQARALRESRVSAALTGLLALSRAAETGSPVRLEIIGRLQHFFREPLTPEQELMAVRALSVCLIRMAQTPADVTAKLLDTLEPRFPARNAPVNQTLCELLVYLGSTRVVEPTLALLGQSSTQEEKVHYLFALSRARAGWTIDTRREYFAWLARARREFQGANMLPTALNYMRAEAEQSLNAEERTSLADLLATLEKPAPPGPAVGARPFVKAWTMADFSGSPAGSNAQRGRRLFAEAGCATCHRVGREGGVIGPDLTGVGKRFDRRALLESIVEPSRVIAEIYRNVSITLKSGAIVDGRIVGEDDKALSVVINPVDPDQRRRVNKNEIFTHQISDLSPMPEGLANTLQRDELLDLVGWLEKGEDP